jgi:hypothetical protein
MSSIVCRKCARTERTSECVDRSLADSKVEAVSTDLRFIAAFNAALSVATTALRASGLRTVTQAGHHVKTIESLELTITANPKVIQRFKTFNNKRNKSVYDVAGAVSDQELDAIVKLAIELREITLAWLQKTHPRAFENLTKTCREIGQACLKN